MGSSSGDSLKKVHLQQMLGLIDRQIQMLRGQDEGRRTEQPKQSGDFKSVRKIENPPESGNDLIGVDGIDVVSYNILSSALFTGDHYRKLDGSVNNIDPGTRRQAINQKISAWVDLNKIICLQEVTDDFMSASKNSELRAILSTKKYNAYFHHYKFSLEEEKNILGLATLVPNSLFKVQASDLLRPWANHEMKVLDKEKIKENQSNITRMTQDCSEIYALVRKGDEDSIIQLDEICKGLVLSYSIETREIDTKQKALEVCNYLKQEIALLTKENKKIIEGYRKNINTLGDRTIIILHLKDSSDRDLVIANVHLPCKYENPIEMNTLALRAKEHIIDWLKAKTPASSPLVLCGDLNSDPDDVTGKAYHCFKGTLSYDPANVNTECISRDEFREYVVNEKWHSCLSTIHAPALTNYGFTERSLERCIREAMVKCGLKFSVFEKLIFDPVCEDKDFEDIIGKFKEKVKPVIAKIRKGKSEYIKPKPLHLDHIFIRDESGKLVVEHYECPSKDHAIEKLESNPIPNLEKGEPSDHLPISVSLKFSVE